MHACDCRYGGNPVCSAGGRAVLRVIDAEKRQAHCAAVGAHLKVRAALCLNLKCMKISIRFSKQQ